MKKKYNIILANAPINNGNRGCVALSISTISIIDNIMRSEGIDYSIFLPDSQLISGHYVYNAGNTSYDFDACAYYLSLNKKDSLKKTFKRLLGKDSTKLIFKKADFILDIGQGDSFADIYGENRFRKIDLIHTIAYKLHKPYCILPQTIGQQPSDVQDQLIGVPNIIEHPDIQ